MHKITSNQAEIKAVLGGWFRLYNDVLDNPKVQKMPGDLFKFWANVLCLSSKLNGQLPGTSEIAFRLRVSDHDAEIMISSLVERDLIEFIVVNGDRVMAPKGWAARQPNRDKSKDRMRKLRSRKRQVTACDASRDGEVTAGDETCDGNVPISISISTLSTVGKKEAGHERKNDLSGSAPAVMRTGGAV